MLSAAGAKARRLHSVQRTRCLSARGVGGVLGGLFFLDAEMEDGGELRDEEDDADDCKNADAGFAWEVGTAARDHERADEREDDEDPGDDREPDHVSRG